MRCAELEGADAGDGRSRRDQIAGCALNVRRRQAPTIEHFGYTYGFGNPDYLGVVRNRLPGQGKLEKDSKWGLLATGELLLGCRNEAGNLPDAPVPKLLAKNGTFMA